MSIVSVAAHANVARWQGGFLTCYTRKDTRTSYTGIEKPLLNKSGKGSHFGTGYGETPLPQRVREKKRIGQNRVYTPYMTIYLVVFLPEIPGMVLTNPTLIWFWPTL
jgi:hypothetical protein